VSVFFYIDDGLINFDDPTALVKDEYREYFARRGLAPHFLSKEVEPPRHDFPK